MRLSSILPRAFAFALIAGLAVSAPVMRAQAATDDKPMTADEKKARSAECSKQADAKGLHGKERHKFRSECKHGKS